MHSLLIILGIAGFLAVVRHALDALLRLLHGDVEAALAGGRASARAHHGDLTGVQEAQAERSVAWARRRVATALLVLWIALLLVPPLTPWPRALYAAYSLLWLLPRRRRRA
jgi:type II secretory pathway component PulL